MEPRHFWRRLIAVIIDFILLSQLAFYVMIPFADGESVRLSGGLYQSVACKTVPLEEGALSHFSEQGIVATEGSLCVSYQNGFYAGTNLLASSETNAQGDISENAVTISVPLNRQGENVETTYPVAALAPIMVFVGIILMTWLWNGQTLGKKIVRVQVLADDGEVLGLLKVISRETLKFAPAIILFILALLYPSYTLEHVVPHLQSGENIALVLGMLGASTFVYILWWAAPLIWWNGSMPYDRINKSVVERYFD